MLRTASGEPTRSEAMGWVTGRLLALTRDWTPAPPGPATTDVGSRP